MRSKVTRSQARRSQSLSPSRLKESEKEVDINNIEIEDDMSLDALEVIKNKLMGKMGLDDKLEPINPDDMEEGEVSDSEDEEPKEKQEPTKERPKESPTGKPKEKSVNVRDLRDRLKKVEKDRNTTDEKILSPVKK